MFQQLIIAGNLGGDPEMRYMPDGTAVTSFSMAVNRKWTDSQTGQAIEEVTWFRVSVWGRQAEAVNQHLSKGSQALVSGRIKPDPNTGGPRLWTAQDGTVRASFEVTASAVQFLNGRSGDAPEYQEAGSGAVVDADQDEDDIPF